MTANSQSYEGFEDVNLGACESSWWRKNFLERKKRKVQRLIGVFSDENTPIYSVIQKRRLKKHHRPDNLLDQLLKWFGASCIIGVKDDS